LKNLFRPTIGVFPLLLGVLPCGFGRGATTARARVPTPNGKCLQKICPRVQSQFCPFPPENSGGISGAQFGLPPLRACGLRMPASEVRASCTENPRPSKAQNFKEIEQFFPNFALNYISLIAFENGRWTNLLRPPEGPAVFGGGVELPPPASQPAPVCSAFAGDCRVGPCRPWGRIYKQDKPSFSGQGPWGETKYFCRWTPSPSRLRPPNPGPWND